MNAKANVRDLIWLTLAALVLLAVAITQGSKMVVAEHAEAVVAASAICVVAGWLAMVPSVVSIASYPEYLVQAGMASIVIRMLLTLGVGMAYLRWASPPRSPFVTALTTCYLALLVLETSAIAYWGHRSFNPKPGRAVS